MSNLITLTATNFEQVIAENEIVVIDFWARWCQPCIAFEPVFAEVASQYPDVIFGKVDTEESAELADNFNIRSIPNLMVIRQKVLLFNEAGMLPAVALKDLIEQAKSLNMEEVVNNLLGTIGS